MMKPVCLKVGDIIVRTQRDGTEYRYEVVGYTPRGKMRLRRPSGTEMTGWWRSPTDLPKDYRVLGI